MKFKKLLALVGVASLGFMAVPSAAFAAEGDPVTFDVSTTCGAITLTTTNNEDVNANWYYGLRALVDGEQIGGGVVQGPGSKSTSITFPEDSYDGSVEVDVTVWASTEQNLLPEGWEYGVVHTFTVDTDCETNVPDEPAPVTVVTVTESDVDCDSVDVTVFTKTTNVGHRYDEETNSWVENPLPSDRSITVETTRDLTEADVADLECEVVPEKPEPIVERFVGKDEVDCEGGIVTKAITILTTDWVLVDNVWVKTEPVETTTFDTRDATAEECPLPVTPVVPDEPVVDEPVVVVVNPIQRFPSDNVSAETPEYSTPTLAETGAPIGLALPLLAGLGALGAGAGLLLRRRK